jgi:Reverse transcriptase (RNA-dependent DNA polymerase)
VLNTDYKVFTKALTNKLSEVAGDLIHPNQAGFMAGWKIEDHTKLIKMVIERSEAKSEEGYLVFLDQEKAYDKITHNFLQQLMEAFNIPPLFRKTVKTL